MMHCAHLPKLIKEHFKVDHLTFETSDRGIEILYGNPYVDKLIKLDTNGITNGELMTRWEYSHDSYDLFFNLMHTIESEYCLLETDSAYYRNDEYRRERFGKMNSMGSCSFEFSIRISVLCRKVGVTFYA